ncbi:MAG: serine/threonine-protein kinase [Myxococcota bacterium]|nr:serine/threonine-protein kinase [Myxococcota bacterium]
MKDTRDQITRETARPKANTEPLPVSESEIDPFYDPARDLPDVGNRFELLGRLGEGGMGEVFKARDVELDEIVALKILTPQFGEDQSRLDRLKQEVKLARKISSPGVCRIHDLVELPNGIRGIAMEFIEGQTLGALVDQGLEVDYLRFAKWGADISEGLAAAHKISVIHRDLKPENVMITTDDRAMILDFGVARNHEPASKGERLTQEGTILGTIPYMAPEQLSNAPLDPRSDLYSLGLILAELVTGEIPFYGDGYHETLKLRVIEPEIFELSLRDPAAPEAFCAVVDHLLRTAVEERPYSAMMVADHFREFSGTTALSVDTRRSHQASQWPGPINASDLQVPKEASLSTEEVRSERSANVLILAAIAILCVGVALAVAKITQKTPRVPRTTKPLSPTQKPDTQTKEIPRDKIIKKDEETKPKVEVVSPKIKKGSEPATNSKPKKKKRNKKKRQNQESSDEIPLPEEL